METQKEKKTLKDLFPKLFMTGILVYTVMINLNSNFNDKNKVWRILEP